MTNILIIDDERMFRAEHFVDATYARTVDQAMYEILRAVPFNPDDLPEVTWEEVWWDHDLGTDAQGRLGDVQPVLRLIEMLANFGATPEILQNFVHSSNPAAVSIAAGLEKLYSVQLVGQHRFVAIADPINISDIN